jgi:hypothetical protein
MAGTSAAQQSEFSVVRIARKGAIETPDQEDVVRQAKTIL